jgi:hypothetical protein
VRDWIRNTKNVGDVVNNSDGNRYEKQVCQSCRFRALMPQYVLHLRTIITVSNLSKHWDLRRFVSSAEIDVIGAGQILEMDSRHKS